MLWIESMIRHEVGIYIFNGMPVYYRVPCTYTFTHSVTPTSEQFSSSKLVGGNQRTRMKPPGLKVRGVRQEHGPVNCL